MVISEALGAPWALFVALGRSCGALGTLLDALGTLLGSSWGALGTFLVALAGLGGSSKAGTQ